MTLNYEWKLDLEKLLLVIDKGRRMHESLIHELIQILA